MKNEGDRRTIHLGDLDQGILPEHIIAAIKEMELSVSDLAAWIESLPMWHMHRKGDVLVINLKLRIPVKKLLATLSAVLGLLWALRNYILE